MIRHLTDQEFTESTTGDLTPDAERHVASCSACASELARFRAALSSFRDAVREWSEVEARAPGNLRFDFPRISNPSFIFRARWALAAVVLFAIVVPLWRGRERRENAQVTLDTTVLLEQVDAELSRSVPPPMEPLLSLMGSDSVRGEPPKAVAPVAPEEHR